MGKVVKTVAFSPLFVLIGAAAQTQSPAFDVISGSCVALFGGACVTSPNYPASELHTHTCEIRLREPAVTLKVVEFVTFQYEPALCYFVSLTVNGDKYCGEETPNGKSAAGTMLWSFRDYRTYGDAIPWKSVFYICEESINVPPLPPFVPRPPPPPLPLPPSSPPPSPSTPGTLAQPFSIISGLCRTSANGHCVSSPFFPYYQEFIDTGDCNISVNVPEVELVFHAWNVPHYIPIL
eukprot:6187943-Pleurochrysis_carterae.AAC.1